MYFLSRPLHVKTGMTTLNCGLGGGAQFGPPEIRHPYFKTEMPSPLVLLC